MRQWLSLVMAVVFSMTSVFGFSAPVEFPMVRLLSARASGFPLSLPVAKGLEIANGKMIFIWGGDKNRVVIGKNKFLKAFFTALQLKDKHFWVDMGMLKSVYEVLDPALVGTVIGKVFVESDIELKKKAMEMLRDVEIEGENLGMFRLWIVPDKAEVLEKKDGMGVEIKNLRLKVKAEIVRGMGDEMRRYIEGEMVKELTREVNEGKEFEALRKVFGAIVLARWYKERAREGWPYYEIAGRDVMNDSLREDNWSVREYLEEYGRIVVKTIETNDVPFVGGGIDGIDISIEVSGKEENIGNSTDFKDRLGKRQVTDGKIDKDTLKDEEKEIKNTDEYDKDNLAQAIGAIPYQALYKDSDLWDIIQSSLSNGEVKAIEENTKWSQKTYTNSGGGSSKDEIKKVRGKNIKKNLVIVNEAVDNLRKKLKDMEESSQGSDKELYKKLYDKLNQWIKKENKDFDAAWALANLAYQIQHDEEFNPEEHNRSILRKSLTPVELWAIRELSQWYEEEVSGWAGVIAGVHLRMLRKAVEDEKIRDILREIEERYKFDKTARNAAIVYLGYIYSRYDDSYKEKEEKYVERVLRNEDRINSFKKWEERIAMYYEMEYMQEGTEFPAFKEMWERVIDSLWSVISDMEMRLYNMCPKEVRAILDEIWEVHFDDEVVKDLAYIYWLTFHPQSLEILISTVGDEKKEKKIKEKMKFVADYYYRNYVRKGKGISITNETAPDPIRPGGIDLRAMVLTPVKI